MPAHPKLKVPLLLAFLMALSGCTTIEPCQVPEYDGSMSLALNVSRVMGISGLRNLKVLEGQTFGECDGAMLANAELSTASLLGGSALGGSLGLELFFDLFGSMRTEPAEENYFLAFVNAVEAKTSDAAQRHAMKVFFEQSRKALRGAGFKADIADFNEPVDILWMRTQSSGIVAENPEIGSPLSTDETAALEQRCEIIFMFFHGEDAMKLVKAPGWLAPDHALVWRTNQRAHYKLKLPETAKLSRAKFLNIIASELPDGYFLYEPPKRQQNCRLASPANSFEMDGKCASRSFKS